MPDTLRTWARRVIGPRYWCVYCGRITHRRVCKAHDDLPSLDPHYGWHD